MCGPPCNKNILRLCSSVPILKIGDPEKPFKIKTNASNIAIGALLIQEGKPTDFKSKKLFLGQKN